ncbi:MAG TPA: 30S ribosome-binding factor RbfA [Longimicrobiales bacterium]
MASKRIARVNEQIRRELTGLLQVEVRDPRIGMVTITGVEVSPDLYHAKVHYSVLGSDEERSSAAEGLRAAAGFLRTEIGRRMHIRRAPELHFAYDDTLQHAMHIERLLKEARASSGAASSGGSAADSGTDTASDPRRDDDSGSDHG